MQHPRRLRRLVPDEALIRRRAAGERLRELASDYDVAHTTLGRYFERPEVAQQLRQAAKQLPAEQRAVTARRSAQRRLEQEVRRRAREQAAVEREQARRASAAVAAITSRRRPARTPLGPCAAPSWHRSANGASRWARSASLQTKSRLARRQ